MGWRSALSNLELNTACSVTRVTHVSCTLLYNWTTYDNKSPSCAQVWHANWTYYTPVLIHSELGNSVDQKKKIKPAVSLVIILCDWCCQIWFDHFAYDNAVLHLTSNFCLLILLTLQELHDLRRKNSALQMQQFVGEEKNDLLDYLRSLTPEKVPNRISWLMQRINISLCLIFVICYLW